MPRDAHDMPMPTRRRAGTDVSENDQLSFYPRMDPQSHHQQQQQYSAAPNTSSQGLVKHRNTLSSFSLSSHVSLPNRVSTMEAYELIYGYGPALGETPVECVERLYETHAGSYENPLITASSRQVIGDINALTRQLRELDVPRPLAMFKTLFGLSDSHEDASGSWFQALRVWSEIEEVYDSESFDGHRYSIIEHTLNVLILPGLHSEWPVASTEHSAQDADSSSLVALPAMSVHAPNPQPVLTIPGFRRLPLPSPFHLKVHVISRLSFNEQGRITRHRDFYDVRDVLALVPGVRAAQWIGTRAAARGLAWASRLAGWISGRKGDELAVNDMEEGISSPTSPISGHSLRADAHSMNALGLQFYENGSGSSAPRATTGVWRSGPGSAAPAGRPCQPPDVDRE